MSYNFKSEEAAKIKERFGEPVYEEVLQYLGIYADKWSLTSFQFIPSYSANLVFKCESDLYGSSILKISNPCATETLTEFSTLEEYKGRPFCKVYDIDREHGIILEERIEPGYTLRKESSLERRLAVFCSLYTDLHIEPADAEIYPTYLTWVNRITNYMSQRQDAEELYLHMKKAQEICISLSSQYSKERLLHGDFHHDNILLGGHGEYKIIDPKGVIGDPIFDTPRFILNEFEEEITPELYDKINNIILTLEKELHIPGEILRQCLYVETAMGNCWSVQDGASPEEFPKLLNYVAFAERILNKQAL